MRMWDFKTDLPLLKIRDQEVLPIVLGGMGVGVSNSTLAGAVAREGGVGTVSSVGLPRTPMYSDVYDKAKRERMSELGRKKLSNEEEEEVFHAVNAECIKSEVRKAKENSKGHGLIAMNAMTAVNYYADQVKVACDAGVDIIVSGAGMPRGLAEMTKGRNVAIAPIVSGDMRALEIIWKAWGKAERAPDFIVHEDPHQAAGHLAAMTDEAHANVAIPTIRKYLAEKWFPDIPVISAGGVYDRNDVEGRMYGLWAQAVQMGTRFVATHESGANNGFKEAIKNAKTEDIGTYRSSALLTARGILTKSGIFKRMKNRPVKLRKCAINCLLKCGYRDARAAVDGDPVAQMCLLRELAWSVSPGSDETGGLLFASTVAPRVQAILSVEELILELALAA